MLYFTQHSCQVCIKYLVLNLVRLTPFTGFFDFQAIHPFSIFVVAAHLVQTLVASYERYYASMQDTSILSTDTTQQDGKECSNLLVLISELYNFQVVSCVLVFDVIRHLLSDNLTEFKVELLLKILRSRL